MIVSVKVKPGVKTGSRLEKLADGSFVAYLHERAKDGEANAALLKLLADYFKVRRTGAKIKSGASGRIKRIEIDK